MSTTVLPPPTSDQDRLNHLAGWHGLPQYTVAEWRATFPHLDIKGQHAHLHEAGKTRSHRHVPAPPA